MPAKKTATQATKKTTSKRELIVPHAGDRRYVRRDAKGEFAETVDAGKSVAADRRQKAKRTAPKGQGDRGDQKRGK